MFATLQNIDWTSIDSIKEGFADLAFISMLVSILACVALAFFAYRFYRICITVAVSYGFGVLGYWLGGILTEKFEIAIDGIAIEPVVGLVLALVGAIIGMCLPKVSRFLLGAGVGYSVGSIVLPYLSESVEFFAGTAGQIIVSVVCALIVAFLFLFFFRFFYILVTSIVGLAAAAALLGIIVYPDFALYFVIGGAVVGIFAMVYQYKAIADM